MNFGQTEAILLIAFAILWWLFYFGVKMRADQKYMNSDQRENLRPCMGCMITQSAMLAAAVLTIIYGAYLLEWIGFSQ
ncbi:hypothetical protein [Terasakiella sp. SH-1]|uniref:hypothetical protein n=1 Tax=Terasakiella sp. SH-1 TaxID=2560057 RepID=UPI0010742368|nr:hypothetical protein [Terasakiella sp. SH-1]